MGHLDNIPKKDFFRTPENYFENLPHRIRQRLEAEQPAQSIRPVVLRYAAVCLASVALIVVMILYSNTPKRDAESILASIETADLARYLQESDVTTDELLENSGFTDEEFEALETEAFEFDLPEGEVLSDFN